MTIGIFGGTFNPPHVGHLIAAEHVRTELAIDRILFIPAAIPPHKVNDGIVAAHHRVQMLRLATQGNLAFEVSEIEIVRGGISYTIDTLQHLKNQHPSDGLCVLIGMDNLAEFHTWKSPERILDLATVVVTTRPGFTEDDVPNTMKRSVRICPVPEIAVASRQIRKRVAEKKSIRYMVPDVVREYIHRFDLYSAGTG
ncbi:MAG: nicotinate-nucleotide adenylyltransferase [Bacteroidetes bacterium]|nr:nicotinate-nucleotide adenylyltransferase [Bacteroidota bacterium]